MSSTLSSINKSENEPNSVGGIDLITNEKAMFIYKKQWGLLIADECHTLPAKTYSSVLKLKFKCKIGLTATPYRGDENICMLYKRIGPKLYEENLLDLIH